MLRYGVIFGLSSILWPLLIAMLVLIFSMGNFGAFYLALLISAPPSLICGALILLFCGVIWGGQSLTSKNPTGWHFRTILGAFGAAILFFWCISPKSLILAHAVSRMKGMKNASVT
jgi:hypothetical protein